MDYKLFLDDIRNVNCVSWYVLHVGHTPCKFPVSVFEDAVVIRNFDAFVECIETKGLPTHISFDHDLADEHYIDFLNEYHKIGDAISDPTKEETGLDCAKFLIDYCELKSLNLPDHIYVHSFNPIGRQNIHDLFVSYIKFKEEK